MNTIESDIYISKDLQAELVFIDGTASQRFRIFLQNDNNSDILLHAESIEVAKTWVKLINSAIIVIPSLTIDNFDIISVIGRGFYGKVMLCKKKDTDEVFAIKSIQKAKLMENDKHNIVISEKNIMMNINHPFIVNLCFAFQTPSKFYLGLEYVPGGELYYHLEKVGAIDIDDARLYVAEIGLALEYLHSKGIVYRDLKPENVLIDATGHMKLTDFGLSKHLPKDEEAKTFCGTAEYLAPEVILQNPYSFPIDIWALGVLTYEMIFGASPFYSSNKSKLYSNIVKKEPYFPPELDERISDFISKLLTKDPKMRPTFTQMKSHPFFEGLEWNKIKSKEYCPGYIPNITHILQTDYFNQEFTDEIAADSFVQPIIGDISKIPGFSYIDHSIYA